MKNKILILLTSLLLTSCLNSNSVKSSSNSNSSNSKESEVNNSTTDKNDGSKNTTSTSIEIPDNLYDTFFTINDVHGSIDENTSLSSPEAGLLKLDYFIKQDFYYNDGSFIVSGGDIYQGGYQAYHNMNLVSDVLSEMGVVASVIGNHEFDWSISTFKNIREYASFPFLGANITTNNKQVDFVDYSYKYTTDTGAKFGIVGVIGPGEESDILTSYISGYSFSKDVKYVEAELDKLKDCDYKIILSHDSVSNDNNYLNNLVSTLIDDNYSIDAVVGAHTHMFESTTISGVPYIQAGSNTKGYGVFQFRRKDKKCLYYGYHQFTKSEITSVSESKLNQKLYKMIHDDTYYTKGNESLGKTLNGTLSKSNHLHKFIPKVMINAAINNGMKSSNPILAFHNIGGLRSDITSGNLTRNSLFKAVPFMNKIRISRSVSGSKLSKLLNISSYKGNLTNTTDRYVYAIEDDQEFNSNLTYDVVTIDYCYEYSYVSNTLKCTWNSISQVDNEDILMPDAIISYVENYSSNTINAGDFDCTKSN